MKACIASCLLCFNPGVSRGISHASVLQRPLIMSLANGLALCRSSVRAVQGHYGICQYKGRAHENTTGVVECLEQPGAC